MLRATRLVLVILSASLAAACPREQSGENLPSGSSSTTLTAPASGAAQPTSQPTAPSPSQPTSQPTQPGATGAAPMHQGEEKHAAAAVDREHLDPDGVVRRGKALSSTSETLTVSAATVKAVELSGKTVKLTGEVESVCQPMGCWFVLKGDKPEHSVRISSKAHDIYVPKSAAGMMATVEGQISVKTLSAQTAQHFEDERALKPGETRKVFKADVQELSIDVHGLEMRKRS